MPRRAEKNGLTVQVGKSWPEEIEVSVGKLSPESRVKAVILTYAAGVLGLQQIAFTAYGWLYSEAILKEMLGLTKYLSLAVLLWAISSKVGDKIGVITKAITKSF